MSRQLKCRRRGGARRILWITTAIPLAVVMASPQALGSDQHPNPSSSSPVNVYDRAKKLGDPIEIEGTGTPYETYYAEPDGTTKVVTTTRATRVYRGRSLVPADPSLVKRGDGSVAPKYSTIDVVFSGGGSGPLASLRLGSESLVMTPPMTLQAPTLSGASATYSEVIPGVDLIVTATSDSFGYVFVVKNATAARNPRLSHLRFALKTEALTVENSQGGGVAVLDNGHFQEFYAPRPAMWDSRKLGDPLAPSTTEKVERSQSAPAVAGPEDGNRIATVAMSASSGALTLTPNRTLLRGAATAFPVYIGWSLAKRSPGWAAVSTEHPSTAYYKWGAGSSTVSEGMGYYRPGAYTKRLFFTFDTNLFLITGLEVVSSTLRIQETGAYRCASDEVQAWLTNGVNPLTTWQNQPAWLHINTSIIAPTAGRPGCRPGGSEIAFDVSRQVLDAIKRGYSRTTFGLRAADETSGDSWRRLGQQATFEAVYDIAPGIRSQQMLDPPTLCGGRLFNDDMPVMQAQPYNNNGTSNKLRARFQIFKYNATQALVEFNTAYVEPDTDLRQQIPSLPAGRYVWRARAEAAQGPAMYSAWKTCDFTVVS